MEKLILLLKLNLRFVSSYSSDILWARKKLRFFAKIIKIRVILLTIFTKNIPFFFYSIFSNRICFILLYKITPYLTI